MSKAPPAHRFVRNPMEYRLRKLLAPFGKITDVALLNGEFTVELSQFLESFHFFFSKWKGADRKVWVLNRSTESTLPYPAHPNWEEGKEGYQWAEIPVTLAPVLNPLFMLGILPEDVEEGYFLRELGAQNPLFTTDAFSVIWKEGAIENYLVSPVSYSHGSTNMYQSLAAQSLAYFSQNHLLPVTLQYDGGNIYACGSVLFVGEDVYREAKSLSVKNPLTRTELESQLLLDFSAEQVVWIQSPLPMPSLPKYGPILGKDQPLYHLDVFFLPLGPMLDPDSGEWVYQVAVAKPYWWHDGDWAVPEEAGIFIESLDFVSEQLSQTTIQGLQVRVQRLPMVFLLREFLGMGSYYVVLSYLNGLIENNGASHRLAYLPKYTFAGETAMETLTEEVMGELGFSVEWVLGSFSVPRFNLDGALHCLVNVVGRESV